MAEIGCNSGEHGPPGAAAQHQPDAGVAVGQAAHLPGPQPHREDRQCEAGSMASPQSNGMGAADATHAVQQQLLQRMGPAGSSADPASGPAPPGSAKLLQQREMWKRLQALQHAAKSGAPGPSAHPAGLAGGRPAAGAPAPAPDQAAWRSAGSGSGSRVYSNAAGATVGAAQQQGGPRLGSLYDGGLLGEAPNGRLAPGLAGKRRLPGLHAVPLGAGAPSAGAASASAHCESNRGGVPGEAPEEGAAFMASLHRHLLAEGQPDYLQGRWSKPTAGSKAVNLAALYRQVCLHGGYDRVNQNNWWRNIGAMLGHTQTAKLKSIYEQFLKSYSDRYFDAKRMTEDSMRVYQQGAALKAAERARLEQAQRAQQERRRQASAGASPLLNGGMLHGAGPQQALPGFPMMNAQVWPHKSAAQQHPQQQPPQQGRVAYAPLYQPGAQHMMPNGMMANVAPRQLESLHSMLAERQKLAAHQAQQAAATELRRQAALFRIMPTPGPTLRVAQLFNPQQLHEVVMCLRSGLPSCVPWALNALALASFRTRPDLLLPGLPGLLPALLQVLQQGIEDAGERTAVDAAVNAALLDGDDPPGPRPPRKRQKSCAEDAPGEPRGWWWERAGLLSDGGEEDERFTWAVCASAILRNLAFLQPNQALLAEPACLGLMVACLEARNAEPSPGFNELACSLLDALRAVAPSVASATPPEMRARLLRALCALLRFGGAAPRLRTAAAGVLGALPASSALAEALADALGGHRPHLLRGLVSLLLLRPEEAAQGVMGEARGDCGPPEVPVQDITPEALQQAAYVAQAEAVSAAAQALAKVAGIQGGSYAPKEALAAEPHAVAALVAVLLGHHPERPSGPLGSATGPPAGDLGSHSSYILRRAMESAAFALWHVSGCPAGERALRVHVRDLACCALSEHAQSNNVAALLTRLQ